MTAMTPGSNIPLPTPRLTVDITAPVPLDVSGLLLTADGKVRSDGDFVFYNQPNGPGVTHRAGAIAVDTAAVPDGIEKVVVTASPATAGTSFAGTEPTATVRGTDDGIVLATFTPPALSTETALVVVEIYRRAGVWKLRAVGQGFADGLAGIATDFGVAVDEPPAPAPPSAPPAPPAAAPTAPAAPAAPPVPPAGFGPPPAMPAAPAPPPPPAAMPAPFPPPPAPGVVPASFPPPPAAQAPAPPGRISLDKGRVSLQKNQSVSLVKNGRPLLTKVRMGLGWEPAYGGRDIDLDASVVAYGPQRNHLDSCYFGKRTILGGSIHHSGDNLTGAGAGDDESIIVDLHTLPADATGLVFTVNSYSGQKFTQIAKAYCRLLDDASGEELVRFDLTQSEAQTGVLMCKLIRQFSGEWEMTAIGTYVKARTVRGMVQAGAAAL